LREFFIDKKPKNDDEKKMDLGGNVNDDHSDDMDDFIAGAPIKNKNKV
jgi:hypothetical protein